MSTNTALALALLILMVLVGGKQGASNFLALALNTILMILAVILMAGGFNPIIVAVVIGFLVLACTIYLGTSDATVAGPAFVSSLIVMAAVLGVVIVGVHLSATAGFGQEDSDALEGFSMTVGVSFHRILVATGLLSTLGAIAEAACAVAADMAALGDHATPQGLWAMRTAIIGTAITTLFFGFFGSFLGLFAWFMQLHYSFATVVNDALFVGELMQVLFAVIAVILTVPITMWVVTKVFRQPGDAVQ